MTNGADGHIRIRKSFSTYRMLRLAIARPRALPPANMERLPQEEKQRVRLNLAKAEREAYALLGSRKDSLVKISNDLLPCREMNAKALAQWFGDRPSCMATHSPAGSALQF